MGQLNPHAEAMGRIKGLGGDKWELLSAAGSEGFRQHELVQLGARGDNGAEAKSKSKGLG